jgi:hypothetical protein
MDVPPALEKLEPVIVDELKGSPNFAARHVICPNHSGSAISTQQVDLRFAISKHVNMRRRMVVAENHGAEPVAAQHRYHPV